ncbi:hypothetical protein TWF281_010386 [Arthrobotrys megalospora]
MPLLSMTKPVMILNAAMTNASKPDLRPGGSSKTSVETRATAQIDAVENLRNLNGFMLSNGPKIAEGTAYSDNYKPMTRPNGGKSMTSGSAMNSLPKTPEIFWGSEN